MKTICTILFTLIISSISNAQELKKEDFLGTWKVINSEVLPETELDLDEDGIRLMEQMRAGLMGTVFSFKEDKAFTMKFKEDFPDFMAEFAFLEQQKWKISEGSMVVVGTEENGFTMMGIVVKNKQDKKYFVLAESPFILEVIAE